MYGRFAVTENPRSLPHRCTRFGDISRFFYYSLSHFVVHFLFPPDYRNSTTYAVFRQNITDCRFLNSPLRLYNKFLPPTAKNRYFMNSFSPSQSTVISLSGAISFIIISFAIIVSTVWSINLLSGLAPKLTS